MERGDCGKQGELVLLNSLMTPPKRNKSRGYPYEFNSHDTSPNLGYHAFLWCGFRVLRHIFRTNIADPSLERPSRTTFVSTARSLVFVGEYNRGQTNLFLIFYGHLVGRDHFGIIHSQHVRGCKSKSWTSCTSDEEVFHFVHPLPHKTKIQSTMVTLLFLYTIPSQDLSKSHSN